MQISYHFGRYARYRPVFKPVQNVDVSILVYVPIRYVPAGTHTVSITLISSINTDYIDSNFIWLSITANLMPLSLNYNPNSNKSSNPTPPYNNPTNSDSPHHHNPRSSLFHVKATTQFLELAQAYESSSILNPFLRLDPPNLVSSISLPTQRLLISSHSSPKLSILDFVLKETHDASVESCRIKRLIELLRWRLHRRQQMDGNGQLK